MYGRAFQYSLIILLLLVGAFLSLFFFRELYPEYRLYQNAFVALEQLRAQVTHTEPSLFHYGVKQIVLTHPNGAQESIDRCTSCHVALDVESYSPTRLVKDVNGAVIRDEHGIPKKEPNDTYIFTLLDQAIQDAQNAPNHLAQLKALRQIEYEGRYVDSKKVLMMHPLIGREERPFQLHSPEEIGCTSCHNGNGRALTSDKAHGPVFDNTYEPSFEGTEKFFLERDEDNDPEFSKVFNNKPGHELLFQTTPLFVGGLIEASCIQCHLHSQELLEHEKKGALERALSLDQQRLTAALENDTLALHGLLFLQNALAEKGLARTITLLSTMAADPTLPKPMRARLCEQKKWLEESAPKAPQDLQQQADQAQRQLHQHQEALKKIQEQAARVKTHTLHPKDAGALLEIDRLTSTYRLGEEEYFWQACYACHRIAGLSRGGVGPDLTQEGFTYPWFIKLKLRWPQGTFAASRMPNMHLDHRELEALTTFLLAQKGKRQVISDIDYKNTIKEWDEGKKRSWESPIPPTEIQKIERGMQIFATEGCAACHRLRGFSSSVGFSLETEKPQEWFMTWIPELVGSSDIPGSLIVERLQEQAAFIDQNILQHAKEEGMLDRLHAQHPELLLSFYSPFAYAMRAKNHELEGEALHVWQDRVQRVLMMYIQEYGLGRLIGPRLNWSGIYRSNAWLMQHFLDPSGMVPRSLMPFFRFDATKFSALTYMLESLGKKNLQEDRLRWQTKGFQPQVAYELYCSQCHGPSERRDEAPLLEWIYPIPKNLRNSTFLRNLTRPRMIESILHGVKGTPMPPWGETPPDKSFPNTQPLLTQTEVQQLVDWLLHEVPSRTNQQTIPKWDYHPEDVIKDLKREKGLRSTQTTPLTVETLFKVGEQPVVHGSDAQGYYINLRFATPENLAAGQRFFVENCAVCHGVEGGGDGPRATEMSEAKPRILTNIHWLDTRDDLRLLRSIKYGVPGTSMVAWGDATTMLQRLQLVLYIRQLSAQLKNRDELTQALYIAFEVPLRQIETQESAGFSQLMQVLSAEKTLAETMGKFLLNSRADKRIWQQFLALLEAQKGRIYVENGKIVIASTNTLEGARESIDSLFATLIAEKQNEQTRLKGQFATPEQRQALLKLTEATEQLKQMQEECISTLFEMKRLHERQANLLK